MKSTHLGGAILVPPEGAIMQDSEHDWDYMEIESLMVLPDPLQLVHQGLLPIEVEEAC